MINFNNKPFNFLPFESESSQFNLTCFYAINLLEQIEASYKELQSKAKSITDALPTTDFALNRQCFFACDALLINSKKLYNCFNINEQKLDTIKTVLNSNQDLWDKVKNLRDTSAHFEERLKFIAQNNERDRVFSTLSYRGLNSWRLELGIGLKGSATKNGDCDFQEEEIYFSSWKGYKNTLNEFIKINIYDLYHEIIEILNSFELLLNNIISTQNICCPSASNLFITEQSFDLNH